MSEEPAISFLKDVRRSMSSSQTTKVARTRQAIFAAVASLGNDDPVTVGDVAHRAGISRAAFYTHFSGLDDLAVATMRDALQKISALREEARGTTYAGWRAASLAMLRRNVEHMVENRNLYLTVFGMPGSSAAFEAAVAELAGSIATAFEHMPTVPARIDIEDAARFIASGTLATITYWLRTDPTMPVDEMVTRLVSFFPDVES